MFLQLNEEKDFLPLMRRIHSFIVYTAIMHTIDIQRDFHVEKVACAWNSSFGTVSTLMLFPSRRIFILETNDTPFETPIHYIDQVLFHRKL